MPNTPLKDTCPQCGAGSYTDGFNSVFNCGSYFIRELYQNEPPPAKAITQKKEGYSFHEGDRCTRNYISILNKRLVAVEEYVKKQTEIPKKGLKSLEEHNKKTFEAYAAANNLFSGFACPNCGEELIYSNPNLSLGVYPPKKAVHCTKCDHKDFAF